MPDIRPVSAADSAPAAPRRRAARYTIAAAARAAGVSARMARHYEAIGLLPHPARTASNYRVYGERDVHLLTFVRRARALGFSIEQISRLLSLWSDRKRSSTAVHRITLEHVAELDRRIAELSSMRRALEPLLSHCPANERPDCPILDDLAGDLAARGSHP